MTLTHPRPNQPSRTLGALSCVTEAVVTVDTNDALSIALAALEDIAHPAYGIGFRGLKQIAKRGLREARAAAQQQERAA